MSKLIQTDLPRKGSIVVSPEETTRYKVTARWGGRTVSATAVVTVGGGGEPPDPPDPPTRYATVTFDSNGGGAIAPITVEIGTTLGDGFPLPTWEEHSFNGWFDGDSQYTAATPIIDDVTLVARWIAHIQPLPITGVTSPVATATPSTAINNGVGFTSALSWNGNPATFDYETQYTATITLTAASGYTFSGVSDISGFIVNDIAPVFVSNNGTTLVFTVTFPQTESAPSGGDPDGQFIDERDGQVYRTVLMPDGKVWMAENFEFETGNSWYYDNDPANGEIYGRLYTWWAAMAAVPPGWHLPTRAEWQALVDAVDVSWDSAAYKLKSVDAGGSDEYGFSIEIGGYWNGVSFNDVNQCAYLWLNETVSDDILFAYYQYIYRNYGWMGSPSTLPAVYGMSVRYVKDT